MPSGPRSWDSGAFAGAVPPPIALGECATFSDDWTFPVKGPGHVFEQGVPLQCWLTPKPPPPKPPPPLLIHGCCLQIAYCQVIRLLYEGLLTRVVDFLSAWLGPDVTIAVYNEVGVFPAMAIVTAADFTLVISSGTVNYQQWALQAFQGLAGPTMFGDFGTMPLWFDCATLIFTRINLQLGNPTAPLVLVGHSYGAAACCCCAARAFNANNFRDIYVLAFGCPKPGDINMLVKLRLVQSVFVVNDDDIIAHLPPNVAELAPLLGIVGLIIAARWGRWIAYDLFHYNDVNGNLAMGPPRNNATAILLPLILLVLLGVPIAQVSGHTIEEYQRRLAIRCGEPCWPMNCELWEILLAGPACNEANILVGGEECDGELPPIGGALLIGGQEGDGTLPMVHGSLLLGSTPISQRGNFVSGGLVIG